jgi:hypothetical protein
MEKEKKKAPAACDRCAPSRREYFVAAAVGACDLARNNVDYSAERAVELADAVIWILDGRPNVKK